MSGNLLKAQLLLSQKRHDGAIEEATRVLEQSPEEVGAFFVLTNAYIGKQEFKTAENYAREAIRLAPEAPEILYSFALATFLNNKPSEAKQAIQRGQQLVPDDPDFYNLKATIAMHQDNWQMAYEEAVKGLEHDPENTRLINVRAEALIKLNRRSEAGDALDYALRNDPFDSRAHSNKGWVSIENNRFDEALIHFREALRNNPMDEYARHGLKEAIKGKNFLYRGVLKYFLWMNKMQEQYRWGFIIGLYIAYRLVLAAAEAYPNLAPFLYPFVIAYIVFAFSSWIAIPFSNFILQLHPQGKHALTSDEKLGANLVGALLTLCVCFLVVYFINGRELLMILGGYCGLLSIPVSGVFTVPVGRQSRTYLALYAAGLAAVGLLFIVNPEAFSWGLWVFAIGILLYSFVANFVFRYEAKRF